MKKEELGLVLWRQRTVPWSILKLGETWSHPFLGVASGKSVSWISDGTDWSPGETSWRAFKGPDMAWWGCDMLREKEEGDVTAGRNAGVAGNHCHYTWGVWLWTLSACAILGIVQLGVLLLLPRETSDSRGLPVRNSMNCLLCRILKLGPFPILLL